MDHSPPRFLLVFSQLLTSKFFLKGFMNFSEISLFQNINKKYLDKFIDKEITSKYLSSIFCDYYCIKFFFPISSSICLPISLMTCPLELLFLWFLSIVLRISQWNSPKIPQRNLLLKNFAKNVWWNALKNPLIFNEFLLLSLLTRLLALGWFTSTCLKKHSCKI